jgi:hypothetical protein
MLSHCMPRGALEGNLFAFLFTRMFRTDLPLPRGPFQNYTLTLRVCIILGHRYPDLIGLQNLLIFELQLEIA